MLPREVREFLDVPGRVLAVKGQAGTGKTLFGRRIGRWFQREKGDVLWAASRYTDPRTDRDLEEVLQEVERFTYREPSDQPPRTGGGLGLDPEAFLKDLAAALRDAERPLAVLDSFDGLAEDLPERDRRQLLSQLVGLVRATGSDLVLVLESEDDHPADYQSDGVVRLTADEHHGRRIRRLHLDKLRGVSIRQPVRMFTLANADFATFEAWRFPDIEETIEPPAQEDPRPGCVSTGTHDWNVLTSGGFPTASAHYLEVRNAASGPQQLFTLPLAINALNLGRGLVTLRPPNSPAPAWKKRLRPHVGEHALEDRVRVLDGSDIRRTPANGADLDELLSPLEIAREALREHGPVTSILHLDGTVAAHGPETVLGWAAEWIGDTHRARDVDLIVASPREALRLEGLVETHWVLERIEGLPFLHGDAPDTGLFAAQGSSDRGFPETELTPVR